MTLDRQRQDLRRQYPELLGAAGARVDRIAQLAGGVDPIDAIARFEPRWRSSRTSLRRRPPRSACST